MTDRCLFLFNELRPAVGNEVKALTRSKLLRSRPRWKAAILSVIQRIRDDSECLAAVPLIPCAPQCVRTVRAFKHDTVGNTRVSYFSET